MPRAVADDFMQNFAFFAAVTAANDPSIKGYFADGAVAASHGAEAGFANVSVPEISEDATEYREGHHRYTRKMPGGVPTYSDSSFQRGIAKESSGFLRWILARTAGAEYRCEITVYHFDSASRPKKDGDTEGADLDGARQYIYKEAFPTRVKVAGDLDATAGDVSLGEVDVAMEYFELRLPGEGEILR